MQYILDEQEMKNFQDMQARLKHLPSVEKLQLMCTKIANEWPTWKGWDGKSNPEPWECILTVDYEHYCDECPVQSICPAQGKHWSK